MWKAQTTQIHKYLEMYYLVLVLKWIHSRELQSHQWFVLDNVLTNFQKRFQSNVWKLAFGLFCGCCCTWSCLCLKWEYFRINGKSFWSLTTLNFSWLYSLARLFQMWRAQTVCTISGIFLITFFFPPLFFRSVISLH